MNADMSPHNAIANIHSATASQEIPLQLPASREALHNAVNHLYSVLVDAGFRASFIAAAEAVPANHRQTARNIESIVHPDRVRDEVFRLLAGGQPGDCA